MEIGLLIIGLAVGVVVGWLIQKARGPQDSTSLKNLQREKDLIQQEFHELDKKHGALQESQELLARELDAGRDILTEEQNRNRHLVADLAEAKTHQQHLEEKLATQKSEMNELQEKFTKEFENLANTILEKKTAKFTEQNKENLDNILGPLKERIKEFETRIEKNYTEENKERISLKSEIKHLMDLNKQLSDDANNLASALKGESKTQGDWGELQLEMVLERAGLNRDVHYTMQTGFRDEVGQLRKPDFIIHLPEDKHLIIDSKVSLTAYDLYFSAESEEDKNIQLKAHLASMRNHIRELGEKNYAHLYNINTPDYVLMYVPIEPAFTLAFRNDEKLFEYALSKNIVLVTTSTLLATMRTVSFIWKQDRQKENVMEIARQGAELYDKFVGFVDDLINVGKRMDQAKDGYEEAMKKLHQGRGNLVRRSEQLRKLGLKTKKKLPPTLVERSEEDNPALISKNGNGAADDTLLTSGTASEETIEEN